MIRFLNNGRVLLWLLDNKHLKLCQSKLKNHTLSDAATPVQIDKAIDLDRKDGVVWRSSTSWIEINDLSQTMNRQSIAQLVNRCCGFMEITEDNVYPQRMDMVPTRKMMAFIQCPSHQDAVDAVIQLRSLNDPCSIWSQLTHHPMGDSVFVEISNVPRKMTEREIAEIIVDELKLDPPKSMVLKTQSRDKKYAGLVVMECVNTDHAKVIVQKLNGREIRGRALSTRCFSEGDYMRFLNRNRRELPFSKTAKQIIKMKERSRVIMQRSEEKKRIKVNLYGRKEKEIYKRWERRKNSYQRRGDSGHHGKYKKDGWRVKRHV